MRDALYLVSHQCTTVISFCSVSASYFVNLIFCLNRKSLQKQNRSRKRLRDKFPYFSKMLFVATSHDTWPFLLLFLLSQVTTPFCSYNFCFCSFYRNELRSYTVSHFILTSFPPNPFCLSFLYCVSWKWMTAEKDLLRTLKHVRTAHPCTHLRRPTQGS